MYLIFSVCIFSHIEEKQQSDSTASKAVFRCRTWRKEEPCFVKLIEYYRLSCCLSYLQVSQRIFPAVPLLPPLHFHYPDRPPPAPEGNIKETGCKIDLPTLAFSKQMSRNYPGSCYLGRWGAGGFTTDQIKGFLY